MKTKLSVLLLVLAGLLLLGPSDGRAQGPVGGGFPQQGGGFGQPGGGGRGDRGGQRDPNQFFDFLAQGATSSM